MEKNALAVPIAIVVSALIIAGAIFFVNRTPGTNPSAQQTGTFSQPAPITEADHVLGDPNADLVYIEYSDFECPFCAAFHETMNELIAEFGQTGQVAWAYRHFPLPIQGHQNAPKIAEGAECVAELGGNSAFWAYTDAIFAQDTQGPTAVPGVPVAIAEDLGLDVAAFEQCLESGKYQDKVETNFNDARDSGGNGTPYTVALLQQEITEGQESDIKLLANQVRVPLNLIGFSGNGMAVSFSGNLPLGFMRGVTQILLGLPVGEATVETGADNPTATTTEQADGLTEEDGEMTEE